MKSVLISIQPKWCEKITHIIGKKDGTPIYEKSVEIRKTRPKIDVPFRCYIYCTKDKHGWFDFLNKVRLDGKVIGEFVCKSILPISITYSDPNNKIALREFPYTCLTDKEIMNYLGNGKQGWGWIISDLVIYDQPKELREFYSLCEKGNCHLCDWEREYDSCGCNRKKPLKRPPQSWCYVEE